MPVRPIGGGERPEDGFTLYVHPLFMTDLARVPLLVLYQLVVVNYGPAQGQCYVHLPSDLRGRKYCLRDLLGPARYDREGDDLATRGLYVDMPPWGYHVFDVVPA